MLLIATLVLVQATIAHTFITKKNLNKGV